MAIKEDNQELTEIEEKDQFERHDILAVEKSMSTKTNWEIWSSEPNYLTCHECGKCFTLKGNLNEHMTIHTRAKSITCQHCGKRVSLKKEILINMYLFTLEGSHLLVISVERVSDIMKHLNPT